MNLMSWTNKTRFAIASSVLTLLLLAGCAAHPVTTQSSATVEAPEALPIDGAITVGKLNNGLRYFIRHNERPENRAELRLIVNAGSILEDDDQQGLAHFVEHMAFNGTEHFEKQELIDFLESIGMRFGADLNAYTSFDETVYMLTVPTDDEEMLDKAFLILQDWAQGVSFVGEEIDKERGVVLEERRLGRGSAARLRDQQFPIIFKDSRYANRLPIGQEEVLAHAPHDALRRYYREWYRPDLMAVAAVGDFDVTAIEKRIRKRFSGLKNPAQPRPRELSPVPDHDGTLFAIATDPEATQTNVAVYYKLPKSTSGTRADYRRDLVEQLYHEMVNARLDELRRAGEPPFLFAFSSNGELVRSRDGYFQQAGVEEGGVERGLEALLTEIRRVEQYGFTATELERVKRDVLRRYEQSYRERDKQRSGNHAGEMVRHFLSGEPMPGIELELEMAREFVPSIRLEELNRLAAEWVGEDNRIIVVSAPEKETATTPDEPALLAVFDRVASKPIEAWVDKVRQEPLVAELPAAGSIVSESRIEELDVTHWTLSNGVQVVLKPTVFKNDEIQFGAFSPGGTSLVDDESAVSGDLAATLVREGGLGAFDRTELEKALAGQVANASAFLGELSEGAGGSASPEDLETMFQLLYLSFTAPRKDQAAVESWIARTRAALQNRDSQPNTVFSDEWGRRMYGDHPRRQPFTVETLERVDLDRAFEIYRDRFADAGDFTFVFVGNFVPDELKPLVLTYLGGLPSTGRKESWHDLGVEEARGATRFEVRRGLEAKSRVRLTFLGDTEFSRQAEHDIRSLASVLSIRLREVLREDKGATYGVGVSGNIRRRPRESYGFTVSFGCAPENVEELTEAVFAEIETLRENGIAESYLEKVRESQIRRRETDLKENGFWRAVLEDAYTYGTDPRLVLEYEELVKSVTSERIRQAAGRYLSTERYLLGVLNPEEGVDASN